MNSFNSLERSIKVQVKSTSSKPFQIPTESNQHMGIVEVSLKINNLKITDFGMASAASCNTNDPQVILDEARHNAQERVTQAAYSLFNPQENMQQKPPEVLPSLAGMNNSTPVDASKMNGGGNKPASSKQTDLIEKLAHKQHTSADTVSQSMYNKLLQDLTGAEADAVIKKLK